MASNCFAASPLPQSTSMTQRYVCGGFCCFYCCLPLPISISLSPPTKAARGFFIVFLVFCLPIRFFSLVFFLFFFPRIKTVLLQANADRSRSFYTFSLSFYCLPLASSAHPSPSPSPSLAGLQS